MHIPQFLYAPKTENTARRHAAAKPNSRKLDIMSLQIKTDDTLTWAEGRINLN
jgi:hypothetical protein